MYKQYWPTSGVICLLIGFLFHTSIPDTHGVDLRVNPWTGKDVLWPSRIATHLTYCIASEVGPLDDWPNKHPLLRFPEQRLMGAESMIEEIFQLAALSWSNHAFLNFTNIGGRCNSDSPAWFRLVVKVEACSGCGKKVAAFSDILETSMIECMDQVEQNPPEPGVATWNDWCKKFATISILRDELKYPVGLRDTLVHEIGHLLGFEHEHLKNERMGPQCERLSNGRDFRTSTDSFFDPQSVMAYSGDCGGKQERLLQLSEDDKKSAWSAYGAPFATQRPYVLNNDGVIPLFPQWHVSTMKLSNDRYFYAEVDIFFSRAPKPYKVEDRAPDEAFVSRSRCAVLNFGITSFCSLFGMAADPTRTEWKALQCRASDHLGTVMEQVSPTLDKTGGVGRETLIPPSASIGDLIRETCIALSDDDWRCEMRKVIVRTISKTDMELNQDKSVYVLHCPSGVKRAFTLLHESPRMLEVSPFDGKIKVPLYHGRFSGNSTEVKIGITNLETHLQDRPFGDVVMLGTADVTWQRPDGERWDLSSGGLSELQMYLPLGLRKLSVAQNSLHAISDELRSLSRLQEFDCSHNLLESLTNSTLPSSLVKLVLSHNKIRSLDADSIAPLVNLEELDVDGNQLASLPVELFRLPKLKRVVASENFLTELPDYGSFASSIRHLDVSMNELTSLPECYFRNSMQHIQASSNRIRALPSTEHSQLRVLSLDSNQLTDLRGFRCPAELRALSLRSNGLHDHGLRSVDWKACLLLSSLQLEENKLVQPPSLELPRLRLLSLVSNGIANLQPIICPSGIPLSPALESLNVANNKLQELPDCLGSTNMTRLDFRSNAIHSIPTALDSLALESVLGDFNAITSLRRIQGRLAQSLRSIKLRSNLIRDVHSTTWCLPNLDDVDVSHNTLSSAASAGLDSSLDCRHARLGHIDLSYNSMPDFPTGLKDFTISSLDVSNNVIQTINMSAPEQWRFSVERLSMDNNRLTSTPHIIYSDLLEELSLSGNQITRLFPPEKVRGTPRVRMVDWSYNKLAEIQESDMFRIGRGRRTVSVKGNQITKINLKLFPPLSRIDMSENPLNLGNITWPSRGCPQIKADLSMLAEIGAGYETVKALHNESPEGFFSGDIVCGTMSSSATETRSHDRTIPYFIFENPRLRSVRFLPDQLDYLPARAPNDGKPSNITNLVMDEQWLKSIPEWFCRSFPNLKGLDLTYNQFTEFPRNVLSCSKLERFFLRNNFIEHIPENITLLNQLQHVTLSGNPLKVLPQALCDLPHLNDIHVSTKIEQSWARCSQLVSMTYKRADLREWPAGVAQQSNETRVEGVKELFSRDVRSLQYLDLSRNKLTEIPDDIEAIADLSFLLLSYNQIDQLPEVIFRMKYLSMLDLSYNNLTALPDLSGARSGLRELRLVGNNIESLPDSLYGVEHLFALFVAKNGLKSLPIALPPKLSVLDASFNRLFSVDTAGAALGELRVAYNPLERLPDDIVTRFPKMKVLTLSGTTVRELPPLNGTLRVFFCEGCSRLENIKNLGSGTLEYVSIQGTVLREIPDELFTSSPRLAFANFYENQHLLSIPATVFNPAISNLAIAGSPLISSLPATLSNATSLIRFNLARNSLESLPDTFGSLKNLDMISLYGNPLTSLPGSLLYCSGLHIEVDPIVARTYSHTEANIVPMTFDQRWKIKRAKQTIIDIFDRTGIRRLGRISLTFKSYAGGKRLLTFSRNDTWFSYFEECESLGNKRFAYRATAESSDGTCAAVEGAKSRPCPLTDISLTQNVALEGHGLLVNVTDIRLATLKDLPFRHCTDLHEPQKKG